MLAPDLLSQIPLAEIAGEVVDRCRWLAEFSEEPGFTTRTFLSDPMRDVHDQVRGWMEQAGMTVLIDAAGNLRGHYAARGAAAPRLIIGSHLDTVPRAGAFDGILGVVLGIALVQVLAGTPLGFQIEVIGFSEEEGVRFALPFIGSRACVGDVDEDLLSRRDAKGLEVRDAIRNFGLDASRMAEAQISADAIGYLEFHIEQGPVLESLNLPLAVVEAVVGQSRLSVLFEGKSNHAGTTPMHLRRDALAGAAEWITAVEREACSAPGLVSTVGRLEVLPGASNVIAGSAQASLDVRHADNAIRSQTVSKLLSVAREIAARRNLKVVAKPQFDQPSAVMDRSLTGILEKAVAEAGYPVQHLNSGAGHDAIVMSRRLPVAMLFLRSPGGISHHPDEDVVPADVEAAVAVGLRFLRELEISLA
jgi:allantoate deiminase